MSRKTHLKIKIINLADEARTIKAEERKLKAAGRGPSKDYQDLHLHRTGIVRNAARHNLLAYGYLRGVPYRAMEAKCAEPPNWLQVRKIVERFGGDLTHFEGWKGGEEIPKAA